MTSRADAEAPVGGRSESQADAGDRRAQAAFLANLSHEIRTPLTSIMGYAELASEHPDLPEEIVDQLGRISRAGETILSIVQDLLQVSEIEAGQILLDPKPHRLADLAAELHAVFDAAAEARGLAFAVEIATDAPEAVMVDTARIRRILLHLVGNALKFTLRGGVTVRLGHEAGALHLRIGDTGPGMSEAQLSRLFERYSHRDASLTRSHGGVGLGLSICQGLLKAMGGRISAVSEPGGGSVFEVWAPAPAIVSAEPEAGADGVAGLRILVVDDNPGNRQLAQAMFGALGADVRVAASGADGIDAARSGIFDLVLMDVRMPGMSGFEAAQRLRDDPAPMAVCPILAFTAEAVAPHEGSPFDGWIAKPLDLRAAVAEIGKVLATRRAEGRSGSRSV